MREAFNGLAIDTTEITYTVVEVDQSARRRSELTVRNF
jgi:hypothetical protein